MHPHGPAPEEALMMRAAQLAVRPADSEKKIAKALDSDADAIIFDLEDSVAPAQKSVARDILKDLPKRSGGPEWWVRVNPLGSEFTRTTSS
jgi:citrate lyase beta subunit